MRRTGSRARTFAAICAVGAVLVTALTAAPPSFGQPPGAVLQSPASDDERRGRLRLSGPEGYQVLTWRSPVVLPMTDARPEFRLGGVLLGHPQVSADRRTLLLPVGDVDLGRVGVWLSGRRLDQRPAKGLTATGVARPPLAGPAAVPGADPGKAGGLDVSTLDYRAAGLPWREYEGDLEVKGHAVLPDGVDDAPLVLFLHGRHQACYGGRDDGSWPCSGRSEPVPSHLGYRYLQRMLASQGYATVSISANGVNQQDWASPDGGAAARSALVRHHLGLLARWSNDAESRWAGRLDARRTVLVGHSRGGEGVNQAAIETRAGAPYRLVGQTLIAPTDFGYQTAGYLPTVTLLPFCDGDVFDLQGQRYVDAAATLSEGDPSLRSSVLLGGANHNFFNTEWTPGLSAAPSFDDWWDRRHPVCGSRASSTRLSAAEQRRVARTFVAASVGAFVTGDQDDVDVIDSGMPVRIPAAGDALAWTHAIGGNRTRVAPGAGATVGGSAVACRAVSSSGRSSRAAPACAPEKMHARELHWTPITGRYATVQAASLAAGAPRHLRMTWDVRDRVGRLSPAAPLDLGGSGTTLDLRVVADPGTRSGFRVRLGDQDGSRWTSPVVRLRGHPGGPMLSPLHAATVRIDPAAAPSRLDRAKVTAIELVAVSDTGSMWVLDAAARRPGLAPVPSRLLPSVVLGRTRVTEGDGPGQRIAQLPFRVRGEVTGSTSFGVAIDQSSFGSRARGLQRVIALRPGQRRGRIEVPFRADDVYDPSRVVQAVFGVGLDDITMSRGLGRVVVEEDDPAPEVDVFAARDRVRYGDPIRVVAKLSAPIRVGFFLRLPGTRLPGDRSLRTDDVPRRWLREHASEAEKGRPLARYLKYSGIFFEAGRRRGVLEIPTRVLRREQGERTLRLRLPGEPGPPAVTVTAH